MYTSLNKESPIVQKYGGTSVGSTERIVAVANRIASFYHEGFYKLAIVVSAMSGETNRIIQLIKNTNPKTSKKVYDLAVSAGEQVSTALLTAALEKLQVPAEAMLAHHAGILTDEIHSNARIRSIKNEGIFKAWSQKKVAIIAGFQGMNKNRDITTLGRGGSDTSAVAVAVALKAAFCEINTDVDGLYSADPRMVPDARLLEEIDYETALEMAATGAKVLHNRCVELAAKYKIPLIVRNSFKEEASNRTYIMETQSSLEAPTVSGVTLEKDIIKIDLSHLPTAYNTLSDIFETLAEEEVNIDIIVHSPFEEESSRKLGFTIYKYDLEKVLQILNRLKEKKGFENLHFEYKEDLSKVSAVGYGMKTHSGVASKIFKTLSEAKIPIYMITTSEIKVACVISENDGEKATQILHKAFF